MRERKKKEGGKKKKPGKLETHSQTKGTEEARLDGNTGEFTSLGSRWRQR